MRPESQPEPFARLGERHALLDLNRHLGVGLDLLRHERQRLSGQGLGQHDNAIHITHHKIPRVDGRVLPIGHEADGDVDPDNLEQGPRGGGANVAREYLGR